MRCPGSSAAAIVVIGVLAAACGGADDASSVPEDGGGASSATASAEPEELNGVVAIDGDRGIFARCTGTGSPTVVMEGGDGDTSDSYAFAEAAIGAVTRTCVYDRANLGQSDPAPGPRGLADLVGDLERVLQAARIPAPYVLVGTSGGGYIVAGYSVAHPLQVAGIVFVDVGAPFRNPPPPIVAETSWDHPANVERRDYLQVEKDAWAARTRIGDIPVTIVSVDYAAADENEAQWPSERRGMRRNVQDQQGWLVFSPRARQIVVHTSHAVEEDDPELVIDVIRKVVLAAR